MWLYLILSLLLLLLSLIFDARPPKKVNAIYGYYRLGSMASEAVWQAANRYSSQLFILIALILNLIQINLFLVLETHLVFIIMGGTLTMVAFLIILFTEADLKKHFTARA